MEKTDKPSNEGYLTLKTKGPTVIFKAVIKSVIEFAEVIQFAQRGRLSRQDDLVEDFCLDMDTRKPVVLNHS